MVVILQRVNSASIYIDKKEYNKINNGLLILIGIGKNDTEDDIKYLVNKIIRLRIFNDGDEKMNLSISDLNGEIMIVSQFTLLANTKKGLRPSFIDSAHPNLAEKLYNLFVDKINQTDLNFKTGKFGSIMDVQLVNNGPATFILDSRN